jgi:hypothetical protein
MRLFTRVVHTAAYFGDRPATVVASAAGQLTVAATRRGSTSSPTGEMQSKWSDCGDPATVARLCRLSGSMQAIPGTTRRISCEEQFNGRTP